ncbi:hypothetical protein [Actinomycetospora sp. NBRC 106375]|nr:hypothetical protein [Actinomycetospora sp. NBRC 106375]
MDDHGACDVPDDEIPGEVAEEVEQLADGRTIRFFSWVGDDR